MGRWQRCSDGGEGVRGRGQPLEMVVGEMVVGEIVAVMLKLEHNMTPWMASCQRS